MVLFLFDLSIEIIKEILILTIINEILFFLFNSIKFHTLQFPYLIIF
jgi:hypothetical protein